LAISPQAASSEALSYSNESRCLVVPKFFLLVKVDSNTPSMKSSFLFYTFSTYSTGACTGGELSASKRDGPPILSDIIDAKL